MPPETGQFIDDHELIGKLGFVVNDILFASNPATSSNFSVIYNIPFPAELARVLVSWTQASSSGTLQIEKLESAAAPGGGTDLLTTAFDLSDTANTVYTKRGRDMEPGRVFRSGDRLGLVSGGTLTNLENLVITMYFVPINRGGYNV